MTRSLARAALVLALLLPGTMAFASPIKFNVSVTATDGPLAGASGGGTFTYDSSIVPYYGGPMTGAGLLTDLDFTWNGIHYDETTANTGFMFFVPSWYGVYGSLYQAFFGTNCSAAGACSVTPGTNQWAVYGPNTFQYAVPGFTDRTYNGTVRFSPFSAAPVPEPASMTLLASGLVGIVAAARRRRSR